MTRAPSNDSKFVLCPHDSRQALVVKDLIVHLAPFWMIDAIDPSLSLNSHTIVLVCEFQLPICSMLLVLLQWNRTRQLVAGVDDQRLLIRV